MSVKNLVKSMLMLSLLVISSGVFAQDQMQKMTPEQRAQRQYAWMQDNLSMGPDQSKKVNQILMSYAQQLEKERSAAGPGPERKNALQQIRQNEEADLKAALKPDQFQKFSQHMQEMKAKMQQNGGGMQQGQ